MKRPCSIKHLRPLINCYGPCNHDLKDNLAASALYALPFGRGRQPLSQMPGWANALIGGWDISNIATLQSGLPFTPTISSDRADTGGGGQRPEVIGRPTLIRNAKCWFYDSHNSSCRALDPSGTDAFAVRAQYTYGNGGINTLRADGLVQFDTSLIKRFHFQESKSLELRASFYNIFSHTTFASPAGNIDSSSARTASSTLNAAREGELAAKLYF